MPIHQLFFDLLLIFLPTQLGYHTWPTWAMVLGRRVDYLSPTLYLTDILLFLTVGSWVVSTRIVKGKENIKLFIFLFLAFIGANIFFAANRFVAVYGWIKVLEYVLLGLYLLQTKPKFSNTILFLGIGVLYSSVIPIAQFYFQH